MDITREDFFHFLWQHLHFTQNELKTTFGEQVRVIHPGYRNNGDGADYRLSKILLDDLLLCGDVELHRTSSEWYRHGHQRDSRYERVILHVVIHDDLGRRNVMASDGNRIPTLELRSSLPSSLGRLWRSWHRPVALACSGLITDIPLDRLHAIIKEWDKHYFQYRLDRMLSLYPSELPISQAWKQMLIKGIFEGLGYHKNQQNMVKLADFFLSSERYAELAGSNSCSLLPFLFHKKRKPAKVETDEYFMTTTVQSVGRFHLKTSLCSNLSAEFIQRTGRNLLEKAGLLTSSGNILHRTDWDFSASRPPNQPSVRVPQAAELGLRIAGLPATDWLHTSNLSLWENICKLQHYPSPGKARRNTIYHNVIVPSVWLLGQWLHDKKTCQNVMESWASQRIQIPRNVRKIFEDGGFPPGKHILRLSMLHHFKYHCTEKRCHECSVMKYLVQT